MTPPHRPSTAAPSRAAACRVRSPDADRLTWQVLRDESRRWHAVQGELPLMSPGGASGLAGSAAARGGSGQD